MTNQELLNSLMNDPGVKELLANMKKDEDVNAVRGYSQNNFDQNSMNNNKHRDCCDCCWCCCNCRQPWEDNKHHCDNKKQCNDDWGIWILLLLLFCGCGF